MEEPSGRRHSPFTYHFRNIGPIKQADLELGDLTIISGRNNTGKTYLAYALYGFLKTWGTWPRAESFLLGHSAQQLGFPDLQQATEQLVADGRATLPLNRASINRQRIAVVREIALDFSAIGISDVFASPDGTFDSFSIELEYTDDRSDLFLLQSELPIGTPLSLHYNGDYATVTMGERRHQLPPRDLLSHLSYSYLAFLLLGQLPSPFILSSERLSISLFYKELDFTKHQLVDVMQKMAGDKHWGRFFPHYLIDNATSRYALPIKDNIDYTRGIPALQQRTSALYQDKLFDSVKDMMEGYYRTSRGDIRFISKARGQGRSFNIPLHLASSSARGLSDFYFFLRHVARTNHLLIIDEPESHLDTANQRLLARLLARSVRAGLKVLLTTHSDYLVMEFNNLVMLSQSFPDKEALARKLKYSADDFLEADSIRAYIAEGSGLTRCQVNEFGIDMPVFDRTIDEINRAASELGSRVSEGSGA